MARNIQEVLHNFKADLKRHHLFLDLESKIKNPASGRSRPRSETLLSAYISLSCGCFERFVQQSFYFAADDLRVRIKFADDPRIIKVDKFKWQNMHGFLRWAAYVKGLDRSALSSKITSYSTSISSGEIYPESFQYTDSNPNAETLKNMFARFGVEDSFSKLSAYYLDQRARSFSASLITTTLDNFVKRRHQAAHHGKISGIARSDVQDDHIFIAALATSISRVLETHVGSIV